MANETHNPSSGSDTSLTGHLRDDFWDELNVQRPLGDGQETAGNGGNSQGPASLPMDKNPVLAERVKAKAAESAEAHVDELAKALHDKFVHMLEKRIDETGGQLTAKDVKEMGDEFTAQLENIKTVFLEAVESYVEARDKGAVDTSRGNKFCRLMVRSIEDLFCEDRALKYKPDGLSRRIMPGIANMLLMMLGQEKMAAYEKRVSDIVTRLNRESDGDLRWEDVYKTTEAKRLALRAEIELAQYFRDTEKRLQWLIAMINSQLIPLEDGHKGAGWELTAPAAEKMLAAIFRDLRRALQNEKARRTFTAKMGENVVAVLDQVTQRFR